MRVVLVLSCWIFAIFCCVFPFVYTKSNADKMEVKISHILVNTEEEAKNIRKAIDEEGKSFEEMAEKYSLCSSKKQKGSIGYQLKNRLLPEVADVAFDMDVRELSQPIESSEGWHLLKVYDIKYYSDKENFDRRYF